MSDKNKLSEQLTKVKVVHLRALHSEIQNANCIISKTGCYLVTFLIPTDLKNTSIAIVCFDDLAVIQRPNMYGFVGGSTD